MKKKHREMYTLISNILDIATEKSWREQGEVTSDTMLNIIEGLIKDIGAKGKSCKCVKLKKTLIEPIGPGGYQHSVKCWLCNKNSAVYDAHPNWHFIPCWKCQDRNKGIWSKKSFLEKLINLFN